MFLCNLCVPYRSLQIDAQLAGFCHMQLEKYMYELVLRQAYYRLRSANVSLKWLQTVT